MKDRRGSKPKDFGWRLISKISIAAEEDSCWMWTASVNPKSGKPMIDIQNAGLYLRQTRWAPAHQAMWVWWTGRPVPPGKFVYRRCGEILCMNPRHLVCGTTSDEAYREMCRKRELRKTSGRSLNVELVRKLRQEAAASKPEGSERAVGYGFFTKKARELGIPRETIIDAVRGKTWQRVDA